MLNSIWLRTFATLAQTRHFTKTADVLNMTQPGVSQHIKKLEEQIGAALLRRSGKSFELTRQGELVLEYARQAAQQEADLREAIEHDDPYQGQVKLACSGSMALFLYQNLLRRQQDYPGLAVRLEVAPNNRILSDLLDNSVDLGVMTWAVAQSEITQEAIGAEPLCVVVPADWNEAKADLASLNTLGFIDHPDGQHYAERVLTANFPGQEKAIKALRVSGYINQISQILVPVAQGLGFTVLPEKAVRSFGEANRIKRLELATPVSDQLFLTRKTFKKLPERYDWFLQEIRRLCSEENR